MEDTVIQALKSLNKQTPFYIGNKELFRLVSSHWNIDGLPISIRAMGRVMANLGHQKHRSQNTRGWIVKEIK